MQTETNTQTKKTLGSVVGQKSLDWIEQGRIIRRARAALVYAYGAYAIALPESAYRSFLAIMSAQGFLLPKLVVFWLAVSNWRKISKLIKSYRKYPEGVKTIEGVPDYEILHHLFMAQSFKREEVLKKFNMSARRFDKLAKKLEEIGVLVRGENNSRVLNNEFTREELADIMGQASHAEEIKKPIRIFQFGKAAKLRASEIKIKFSEKSKSCPPPLPTNAINLRNA